MMTLRIPLYLLCFSCLISSVVHGQEPKKLPEKFFIKCKFLTHPEHLIFINTVSGEVKMKLPDVKDFGNTLRNQFVEYPKNNEELRFGDDTFRSSRFNKWNGVLTLEGIFRSEPCKILDEQLKPLYE